MFHSSRLPTGPWRRELLATNAVLLSTDTALRFPRFNVLIGQGSILTEVPADPARAYAASDGTK